MAQQESQNITLPMSGTGKTDFSLIKSDTTVLHSLECPVNEDFRRSLHDHFVKRMGEDGARRCEAIRGLLDAIGRMLESNDGWLPLADGTFYCAKLDAVLPAPSDVTFRNCYVQLGSLTPANGTPQSWDWQSADSSSDAFLKGHEKRPYSYFPKTMTVGSQKLPAQVPSYGELDELLSGDAVLLPYPEATYERSYIAKLKPGTTLGDTPEAKLRYAGVTADGKVCGNFYINGGKLDTACPFASGPCSGPITDWQGTKTCVRDRFLAVIPIARLHDTETYRQLAPSQILHRWLKYGLTPASLGDMPEDSVYEVLDDAQLKDWKQLAASYAAEPKLFKLNSSTLFDADAYVRRYEAGESLFNEPTLDDAIQSVIDRQNTGDDGALFAFATRQLLDADGIRANINPAFPPTKLTNPTEGLWDLWADNLSQESSEKSVRIRTEVYARNPKADVQRNGVIGIDFGTKNTTVVRKIQRQQEMPLRIGVTDYTKEPTSTSEYENPTVMQFISLDDFRNAYDAWPGRPHTKWEHLTISHTAAGVLKNCRQSQLFSTFLTELKQWAGDVGKRTLRFRDQSGHTFELPPYIELEEDDFDPIEVYAYYLGLTINNQRNGIFLCYELSYPVTYDKEARDRLQASFERGLKKSLPKSILDDDELMKGFRVNLAASEPAAYAICALREFGFRPQGDQTVYYGVFDFGGGTTDFDYGIYRHADEDQDGDDVDYILTHFRPSGDRYLGGENLLQLMAFRVFRDNLKAFRDNNIPIALPNDSENTRFAGDEDLVDDSPEAHLNLNALMTQLRPIWEKESAKDGEQNAAEDTEKSNYDNGITPLLFNKQVEAKSDVQLGNVDVEGLETMLKKRIEHGVKQFFHRMKESFRMPDIPKDLTSINIFLAGNSCKSPIVKELMNQYAEEFKKDIEKEVDGNCPIELQVFPPLGSAEAFALIRERKGDEAVPADFQQQLCCPTGKTGVAFGLVISRKGSSAVRVIDQDQDQDGSISFRWYVGRAREGLFKPVITCETQKDAWTQMLKRVHDDVVELLYSLEPEAGTGSLPESRASILSVNLPASAIGCPLFVRWTAANTIQLVAAKSLDSLDEDDIIDIELQ